jgi:hypothetical protein
VPPSAIIDGSDDQAALEEAKRVRIERTGELWDGPNSQARSRASIGSQHAGHLEPLRFHRIMLNDKQPANGGRNGEAHLNERHQ